MVANYIPSDISITLQSENGFLGLTAFDPENPDENIVNAGGQPCSIQASGMFFDSAYSFALIRGGHVDACVLGGFRGRSRGKPSKLDGAEKWYQVWGCYGSSYWCSSLIIGMEHCAKTGTSKILKKCTLPLTACNKFI